MAKYKDTIITNQGSTMADKAFHGTANYEIFKATGSTTDLSKLSDDEVQNLTKIQDDTKVGYINDSSDGNDNSHTTTLILFNNKDVNQGYYLNTIALWGKDKKSGEVFLYSVTRADQAEFIPAYQDKVLMEFKISIQIKIGNKANVTIVLNSDVGATINYVDKKTSEVTSKLADYLTKSDFNNEKKTINNSLDNKVNNSDFNNFKTDTNKNLSNKADKSELNKVEENVNKNINNDNSPINQKISSLQSDKASHDDLNQTKNDLQGNIDNKADKSYVDTNLDKKATIEQAQYNYSKVLTNNDDFYNLPKGHHIASGATPKNAPYKTIYGDVYVNEHNTFLVDNIENFYYLPDDHGRGWQKLVTQAEVDKQNAQTLSQARNYAKDLVTWRASDNPEYDSQVDPDHMYYQK